MWRVAELFQNIITLNHRPIRFDNLRGVRFVPHLACASALTELEVRELFVSRQTDRLFKRSESL